MKYLESRIRVSPHAAIATVTLVGRTPFLRRRVSITRDVYFRLGATNRQILMAAARKSGYHWNIPFWV